MLGTNRTVVVVALALVLGAACARAQDNQIIQVEGGAPLLKATTQAEFLGALVKIFRANETHGRWGSMEVSDKWVRRNAQQAPRTSGPYEGFPQAVFDSAGLGYTPGSRPVLEVLGMRVLVYGMGPRAIVVVQSPAGHTGKAPGGVWLHAVGYAAYWSRTESTSNEGLRSRASRAQLIDFASRVTLSGATSVPVEAIDELWTKMVAAEAAGLENRLAPRALESWDPEGGWVQLLTGWTAEALAKEAYERIFGEGDDDLLGDREPAAPAAAPETSGGFLGFS